MTKENRAAYLTDIARIEIGPAPEMHMGPADICLRMEYVGVCGSDVHFYQSCERKGKRFALPFILGHECAGTVETVGSEVTSLHPGDRVCIEPQITCGVCKMCKSGHYNMCPHVIFPSVPPYDGMLRNYAVLPAQNAFKLPDNVSTKEGALIEPLAVGLSAASRGEVSLGKRVVILGSGCIGLTTMLACRAMGASKIMVVDLFENRLAKALELGADEVVNASNEDVTQRVMQMTNGEGADVVFETAGSPHTAAQTPDLVCRCGIIVMVGNINAPTPYRFMDLMYREAEVRTIYRYRNNFAMALEAVSSGQIPISKIVSNTYDFEQTQQAFDFCANHKQEVIKSVIKF